MNKPFYVGSYREDGLNGPNNGWIVGNFKDFPLIAPRNRQEVEIKYWEYEPGPTDHPRKVSSIVECTFILKGKIRATIGDEEIVLNGGDYVVVQPGIPNNTAVEVLEPTVGLTIKAPSDPSAKKILQ